MRFSYGVLAIMAAASLIGGRVAAQKTADDPYLWLENVHGEAPLAWVEARNAVALERLKGDPAYQTNYDAILDLLDAEDRIPMGSLRGPHVFNHWRDAEHVRGLWRRTSIGSYESEEPEWEVLLDVDALALQENENWVFEGTNCAPSLARCLVSLSRGGTDAAVTREFDLETRSFIENGFALAEAKSDATYVGDDVVLFATDFGEGTMTASGYPRIVKRWRRADALDAAVQLFEGTEEDVGVWPFVMQSTDGPVPTLVRAVSFFESEYYFISEDDSTLKLPLPLSAELQGMTGDRVLVTLRRDWVREGQDTIAQGTLFAFSWESFLAAHTIDDVDILFTPGPRSSIETVATGRDAVYVSIYDNVTGSVHVFRYAGGAWQSEKLPLPEGGSTNVASVNEFGPEAFFTYQGFLTPTTLYSDRGDDSPRAVKSLPARFDASGASATQYEATSKDGTKIPYFVVRPNDADGPSPSILYGYGGFENSLNPWYWSSVGRTWLPKGGAYAVANIRGGGEFGPAWHEAALKTNRQRAYDDFIAVAEDMIARGLTSPERLGIMGGSNGGLLVGAVAMQRPDLFKAVVCQVPLLDMIRYMEIGAGASWEGEYGDPNAPAEREAILRYSPYQNVRPWAHYPNVFFVTATSDDRVTPVHARKMAALMEAQGHDYLFYENTDGGHAAAANNAEQAEMLGLTYTYFAQELGLGE
jgi:prolyl oligopeptidase